VGSRSGAGLRDALDTGAVLGQDVGHRLILEGVPAVGGGADAQGAHGAGQGGAAELHAQPVAQPVALGAAPVTVVENEAAGMHDPLVPAQLLEGDVEGSTAAVGVGSQVLRRALQQAQGGRGPGHGRAASPLVSLGPGDGHQEGHLVPLGQAGAAGAAHQEHEEWL